MRVIIGSDHAGYNYKTLLIAALQQEGYEVMDLGTDNGDDPDDYLIMPPMLPLLY